MNRRGFLRNAATVLAAFPYVARSTVLGANDRIRIGFVGLGGRAQWLLKNEDFSAVEIAAVADCWLQRCDQAAKILPDGERWARYQDYRRMLEKEKLDAVFIETTTHARVLIAIHALQAGLDVYAEKPVSLTVAEGRALAEAVRRYKRILQAGTQQRSMPINVYASKLVSDGKIGKIEKVIVCNFLAPERWKPLPEQPAPEDLNWDQWCNQTELRPYHKQLHTGWARWRDYDGGGQSWGVSGWGTHSLDQVQAALGADDTGPVEIVPESAGSDCKVTLRYASGAQVSLEQPIIKDHQQLGAIFLGTRGRIQILRGDFVADPPELKKAAPEITKEGPGEDRFHLEDFFSCVRSRRRPNADVEIAHRSTTVCHLVNICREVGRKLKWDPKAERFLGDEEADKLLSRPRRAGYELPSIS
jgi:predicted dehydrogenase